MEELKEYLAKIASIDNVLALIKDRDFKIYSQGLGLNLTHAHYYSPIPFISDLDNYYERYEAKPIYNHESVFNLERMAKFLDEIKVFESEFKPPLDEDASEKEFYVNNNMFTHSDAMAYFCILRHLKPKTIFEIGSGYSTLVASKALSFNGLGKIIANEPYPRDFLLNLPNVQLKKRCAQDLKSSDLNLNDGDVIFIDSTHTVKEGSDVVYIICNLLPNIKKTVYIHFHDIFLPFSMPKNWTYTNKNWSEQYLLYAFLLNNPLCEVLYGSAFNASFLSEKMTDFTVSNEIGGGSLWFKLN